MIAAAAPTALPLPAPEPASAASGATPPSPGAAGPSDRQDRAAKSDAAKGDAAPRDFDRLLDGEPSAPVARRATRAPVAGGQASERTTAEAPVTPATASTPGQLLELLAQSLPIGMAAPVAAVDADASPAASASALPTPAAGTPSPAAPATALAPAAAAAAPAAEDAPATFSLPGMPGGTIAVDGATATATATVPVGAAATGAAPAGPDAGVAASVAAGGQGMADAVPALATSHAATPHPAAATEPPALPATAPLPQPADPSAGYDDGFGTHVAWMAGERVSHAQIRISPEHLGVIDIRLQLDGSDVRAEFHSAHAEVRHSLEASLPRLRELLGQHGLSLAGANVGQDRGERSARPGQAPGAGEDGGLPADASLPAPVFRRGRGLVDVYA